MKKYIVIFALMVFGWPLLPEFSYSEGILIMGLLLVIVGMILYRGNVLQEAIREEDEFKDIVRNKIQDRQDELKIPEMRDNAEKALSDDEKAMMRIVKLHPEYRRTGEFTPQMFGAKIDTKV